MTNIRGDNGGTRNVHGDVSRTNLIIHSSRNKEDGGQDYRNFVIAVKLYTLILLTQWCACVGGLIMTYQHRLKFCNISIK